MKHAVRWERSAECSPWIRTERQSSSRLITGKPTIVGCLLGAE